MFQVVEGCERQGLDDLLVTASVASQPDALIKARDVGERHALPTIVSCLVCQDIDGRFAILGGTELGRAVLRLEVGPRVPLVCCSLSPSAPIGQTELNS